MTNKLCVFLIPIIRASFQAGEDLISEDDQLSRRFWACIPLLRRSLDIQHEVDVFAISFRTLCGFAPPNTTPSPTLSPLQDAETPLGSPYMILSPRSANRALPEPSPLDSPSKFALIRRGYKLLDKPDSFSRDSYILHKCIDQAEISNRNSNSVEVEELLSFALEVVENMKKKELGKLPENEQKLESLRITITGALALMDLIKNPLSLISVFRSLKEIVGSFQI